VTEQKSPLEQALDLIFYAPVGLAITAREELPRLIEKGRQRVTGQVVMAKMIGQFAVNQGQHEAGKVAKQAGDTLASLGILPGGSPSPPTAPPAPAGPKAAPAEPKESSDRLEQGGPGSASTGSATFVASGAVASGAVASGAVASGSAASGAVGSANGKPANGLARSAASSGGLAIPGYDSLSASQVVQRLAGLVPAELEAVRDYEASTRGRRTILNRIAQLQTGSA
jgi:hypothetical protein